MPGFLRFFVSLRFGVFSAMGVKKYHKRFLQNNRVEKFLQKIDFFSV
jgi:hypothetical protein